MASRAKGRAAILIAAGVLLAVAAPASAEPSSNEAVVVAEASQPAGKPLALVKPAAPKKVARARARVKLAAGKRKPAAVASVKPQRLKSAASKAEVTTDDDALPKALPPNVADASALMPPPPAAAAPPAPLEIAAADQLNELDRALAETPAGPSEADRVLSETAAAPSPAPAEAAPVTRAPPALQVSSSRPANETSLLGKIFIAFGGLLTLASAARMLIA